MVIGINPGGLTGGDQQYVQEYASNLGLDFAIYMDGDGSYQQYAFTESIAPFPLDVVVDKSGVIQLIKRDFDIDLLLDTVMMALEEP